MTEYAELHAHSYFSLLDGASSPEELVARAAEVGMPALALVDHDALYGAVRFVQVAKSYGIQPILGAEMTLEDGHHLTLLVENESGWRNLCRLITTARHNAPKGTAALPPEALVGHADGLIALSGCRKGEIPSALLQGGVASAVATARRYAELFGRENFWIELQNHLLPGDDELVDDLVALARRLGLGYVATNDVHYARREGHRLQDILIAIRHNTSLDKVGNLLRANSEFYLKSAEEMQSLFSQYPEALENTVRIADRCQFELRYGLQELPQFPVPPGMNAGSYLRRLCEKAMHRRYPTPSERVRSQLSHELSVIEEMGLSNYFLIVWDIVQFCRRRGILCQGRGSAANSLVAYLLDITPVDPIAHDLVFERFLSKARPMPPDIDIDIQADRREEVIQYIYRRYGEKHAAMASTLVTFRTRSAVRDVAKALGLSPEIAARALEELQKEKEDAGYHPDVPEGSPLKTLLQFSREIAGFPRHLGIHNGGMVVTGDPLSERVPTEPASMPGRVVVQWDKDSLEDAGLVKIDLLGLRMLSAISEAVELVSSQIGHRIDLDRLRFDDPEIYAMIAGGDTIGVFQIESRAQAQVLPLLQPREFRDLVISISLIRPGPIQGNMVHPYLRRRRGLEPVTYPHPLLKEALEETLGVILFQEQVLKVARDLAGFTPGQGEQLRRALGRKDAGAAVAAFHDAFIAGAAARGVSREVAEEVFARLQAFGGYSFPKSHAAAFAVLVYRSAWLKRYHPVAFYTALLNNQPMGFWSPAVLVGDARRHGIKVLPVDVNRSGWKCVIEGNSIRLGLNYVNGLGEVGAQRVLSARKSRRFSGLAGFCRRTRLPRRVVEDLIQVGAMDSWGERRRLLWKLQGLRYREDELDLQYREEEVELPPFSRGEMVGAEYRLLGLSTGEQVMALYRDQLEASGILTAEQVARKRNGEKVRVAGLVVVHQAPPTANGHHFLTLEDETGLVDIIVRPKVYAAHRAILNSAPILVVEGVVQKENGRMSVLAWRVGEESGGLARLCVSTLCEPTLFSPPGIDFVLE